MKTRTPWTLVAVACIIASGAMLFAVNGAMHAQAEDPPERFHNDSAVQSEDPPERFHFDRRETVEEDTVTLKVRGPGLDPTNEPAERIQYDKDEVQPALIGVSQLQYGPGAIDDIRWAKHERKRFVGHWRLVSFVRYDAEGNATERPMTGRIMYDAAGNMSAQLMPAGENVEAENGRTQGYVAYFGTYELEPVERWVTHRPEGSNIHAWVGGELKRRYRFEDGKLLLSLERDDRTTGTLTWERIEAE